MAANTRSNPALYHRLSKPRPEAEVRAAIEAFDAEVYALREKHGICDLQYTAVVAVEKDGGAMDYMSVAHYGDTRNAVQVAVQSLAHWRKSRQRTEDAVAAAPTPEDGEDEAATDGG